MRRLFNIWGAVCIFIAPVVLADDFLVKDIEAMHPKPKACGSKGPGWREVGYYHDIRYCALDIKEEDLAPNQEFIQDYKGIEPGGPRCEVSPDQHWRQIGYDGKSGIRWCKKVEKRVSINLSNMKSGSAPETYIAQTYLSNIATIEHGENGDLDTKCANEYGAGWKGAAWDGTAKVIWCRKFGSF